MAAVLLAVLYYLGAKVGTLTLMPEGIAIMWLPNGILLGFLLRQRTASWPLFAAALIAEIAADWPAFSVLEAVQFWMINSAEVIVARWILARLKFDPRLPDVSDVLKFLIAAPGVAALLAACAGSAVYSVYRPGGHSYLEMLRVWWFGDALGVVLMTPWFLSLSHTGVGNSRINRVDWLVAAASTAAMTAVVIARDGMLADVHVGPIILVPFVMYAAIRFGAPIGAVAMIGVAVIVVVLTSLGRNPFGHTTIAEAVVHAQEFIFVTAFTQLGLVAALAQLRRMRDELAVANATLEARVVDRTRELETALSHVKTLSGLLPICSWCRRLRDDDDYWQSLETYIERKTDARLTHGICPECEAKVER